MPSFLVVVLFGLEHVALSSQGDSATAVYAAVWSLGGVLT